MTVIERLPEDDLIYAYERAQSDLRMTTFPALVPEEVTDDGETWMAMRCPRCGSLVEPDELYAVSPAEHWGPNQEIDDASFERQQITFDASESPELEETLYYKHGDMPGHAVSLPDGWTEDWT